MVYELFKLRKFLFSATAAGCSSLYVPSFGRGLIMWSKIGWCWKFGVKTGAKVRSNQKNSHAFLEASECQIAEKPSFVLCDAEVLSLFRS
jgi:hypothetical protein